MKRLIFYLKEILKIVLSTIICSIIAVCIMAFSFSIPMNRDNLNSAISLGEEEGWYVDALEHIPSLDKYFTQYQPGIMTVADDVRGFRIADDHEGFNALENSMYCNDYPRYWHGYASVMRILLLLLNYKEMRFLNLLVQTFLIICIFVILRDRGEKKISWVVLIWYALMMPISVACCLVYGIALDSVFLSTILVMLSGKKIWNNATFYDITFCIIGCVICFFDLLIFSPMGWAMPFAMMVILYGKEENLLSGVEKAVRSAVSWVVGYGLFWILKIVYASAILSGKYEKDIFAGAIEEVNWSSGKNGVESLNLIEKIALRWSAVHTNYLHYTYSIYALIILAIGAVATLFFIVRGFKKDKRIPMLFIVTASPVVWIFLINTATEGHHIFDYRLLSTEICCSFIMIILSLNEKLIKNVVEKIAILKRLGAVLVVGLIGVMLSVQIKEDMYTTNADKLGTEWVAFPESGVISMSFTPIYKDIIGFGLLINPQSVNGEYRISTIDNGTVVNEWVVPASDFVDNNWQIGNFDWKVSRNHEYTLEIKAFSDEGFGSILTYPSNLDGCVQELGNIQDGGDVLDCQLVGMILYRRRVSIMNVLTYSVLIAGFIASIMLAIKNIKLGTLYVE